MVECPVGGGCLKRLGLKDYQMQERGSTPPTSDSGYTFPFSSDLDFMIHAGSCEFASGRPHTSASDTPLPCSACALSLPPESQTQTGRAEFAGADVTALHCAALTVTQFTHFTATPQLALSILALQPCQPIFRL